MCSRSHISFNAEKYVNKFHAKKHDHFLIPAGTIHCSSKNCMVLEISATPYIFTFKLWDWDRLVLDVLPRPIHIEDGEKNIQWNRTTSWVKDNLVNHVEVIHDGDDYLEERTGLHELEFIDLVEGQTALVESPKNEFEPYTVHYAETFTVPANVKEYTIRPLNDEIIKVIKAYVRN